MRRWAMPGLLLLATALPAQAQRGTFGAPPAGDVHFRGPVASFSALPACSRSGDFVIVLDTLQSYVCKADAWQAGGAGAPGSQIFNGAGLPSSGLGISGDYYLRTATLDLYAKSSSWAIIANLKGADGAAGATGQTGAQGPQGLQGSQGVAGSTGAQGPQGVAGPTGTAGAQGPQGATGPTGPTGAMGSAGAAGTSATLAVGTVTTGAPGSSTTVTNSGTPSAAVFDIATPRGDTGAAGAAGATGPTGPAGPAGPAPSGAGNLIVATPDGSSGTAAPRAMVRGDLPNPLPLPIGGAITFDSSGKLYDNGNSGQLTWGIPGGATYFDFVPGLGFRSYPGAGGYLFSHADGTSNVGDNAGNKLNFGGGNGLTIYCEGAGGVEYWCGVLQGDFAAGSRGLRVYRSVATVTNGSGSPYPIAESEVARLFVDTGAGAKVYLQLPAATTGRNYGAAVVAVGIRLVAGAAETLRIAGLTSSAGGYCESSTIGDAVQLVAAGSGIWVAVSVVGVGWICI